MTQPWRRLSWIPTSLARFLYHKSLFCGEVPLGDRVKYWLAYCCLPIQLQLSRLLLVWDIWHHHSFLSVVLIGPFAEFYLCCVRAFAVCCVVPLSSICRPKSWDGEYHMRDVVVSLRHSEHFKFFFLKLALCFIYRCLQQSFFFN